MSEGDSWSSSPSRPGPTRGAAGRVLATQPGWSPSGAPSLTSVRLIVVAEARVVPVTPQGSALEWLGVACWTSVRDQLSPGTCTRMGGASRGHTLQAKPAAYSQGLPWAFKFPPQTFAAGLAHRASALAPLPAWPRFWAVPEKSLPLLPQNPPFPCSVLSEASPPNSFLSSFPGSFPRIIPWSPTSFWNQLPGCPSRCRHRLLSCVLCSCAGFF